LLFPLLLLMGIAIYLFFRDVSNLVILARIPAPEFARNMYIQLPPSILSDIVRYNLAGMLWFVSGILFLRFMWFHKTTTQRAYIGCFYVMGALFEISQLSERVTGTFDVLDLLFMGIGAFVEGLLYTFFVKRRIT